MLNDDEIAKIIKKIERLLLVLGVSIVIASLYILYKGHINGITSIGNVLLYGSFYLIKRKDFLFLKKEEEADMMDEQ